MTEELAKKDAYVRYTEAFLVEAAPKGVVLDRTVFYAEGGGQPGDHGWLRWDGGELKVTDTVRRGGKVVQVVEGSPPGEGTAVQGEGDWGRRPLFMRNTHALQ